MRSSAITAQPGTLASWSPGVIATLDPTLPQRVVDRAYERDPLVAATEYGAEFRNDVKRFLGFEIFEASSSSTDSSAADGGNALSLRFDPCGGARHEAHDLRDKTNVAVLDCIR